MPRAADGGGRHGMRPAAPPTSPSVGCGGGESIPPRTIAWGDDFAESAAYELVLQTFEWFGVDATAVPFVDPERRLLDSAALRAHLTGSGLSALAARPEAGLGGSG